MQKSLLPLLAVLLAIGFCAGLARLFALRYEAGEVYPPYSTLRSDPLGAKAIYAALGNVSGVEVRRNLQPLKKLQPGQPVTIVYLGVERHGFWTERELEEFESLVFGGARVVFAFFPFDRPPGSAETRRDRFQQQEKKRKRIEAKKDEEEEKSKKKKDEPEDDSARKKVREGLISFDDVAKRYGFGFAFLPAAHDKAFDRHAYLFEPGGRLERDISWHSALYFAQLAPEWKPLYLSESKPVIAERAYGRGSIVLVADSFPFSNEALRDERHPRLLARIFNGPPLVIFDEEHLGVTDQPGIVQLALKYRLHGVIATLALIAGLFLWKNTARFVPSVPQAGEDGELVIGRDATQGFDNLLHRAIKPSDLLGVCVEEWRHAFAHDPKLAQIEEIFAEEQTRPAKQRDAVATYREIAKILAHGSRASQL